MASRVFPTIFSRRLRTVLWALFVVPTLLYGQARSAITGSVVDEHNRPLPNVNLFFKQAKRGTVTNSDGQFRLRLPETGDTLTASCIGYETQDIPIAQDRFTLSIRLVPADVPLNEVIVTNLSARELLQKAIEKIPQNYPQTEFLTNIFYRAKINDPATDSLLYAEEAAIEQIKSYRRKAKDRTFLVRNRNFNFDKGRRRISGMGLFDYVKVLNDQREVSRKNQLTYGPFSSYDNRSVYVVELNKDAKNRRSTVGRFYIDTDDLAFVRVELSDGQKRHITQYKKMDSLYFLTSSYVYNMDRGAEGDMKVSAEWVLTEMNQTFRPEDIQGVFIRDEESEILHSTPLAEEDTVFWKAHNQTLPDRSMQHKMVGYASRQRVSGDASTSKAGETVYKRLYTPNLTLSVSTQFPNDMYLLARNATSINQLANYTFQHRTGNLYVGLALSAALHYSIIAPWEDIAVEQQLLSGKDLKMRYHPFAFNSFGRSYHYGVPVSQMDRLKTEDYTDFMRLHTVRSEYRYVKARMQEEEIVRVDTRNRNNLLDYLRYYSLDLLYNRMYSVSWTPLKDIVVEKHNESETPLIVDVNKSWVKYLFEPETPFSAHITRSALSDEAQRYLRRSSYLSWLNLCSLPLFGVSRIPLGRHWQGSFSLGYLRTPFGEQMEQNIWLSYKRQLHGVFVRQYVNHEKTGWGLGYKLYDVSLNRHLYLTSYIDYWLQPADFRFYDRTFRSGFRIGQELEYRLLQNRYTRQNRLSIFLGYDYKTKGYVPDNLRTDASFRLNAGCKINF